MVWMQCGQLWKEEIEKQAIFLAIDNVTDSIEVIKQAQLLSTRLHKKNIVIVTSRALEVLKGRQLGMNENSLLEMPELEKEEAKALFIGNALPEYIGMSDVDEIVNRCLEQCYFGKGDGKNYHYHPLALEVLGKQFGGMEYNREKWARELEKVDVFNRKRDKEHPLFGILRKSFESLWDVDKMLFMDVALFLPKLGRGFVSPYKWLSMIYEGTEQGIMELVRLFPGLIVCLWRILGKCLVLLEVGLVKLIYICFLMCILVLGQN